MNALIRAGRLAHEPLVLATRRSQGDAECAPAPQAEPVDADLPAAGEPGMPESTANEQALSALSATHGLDALPEGVNAGVAAAALTYAEYKEHFRQELESEREAAVREGYLEGEARARAQVEAEYAEKLNGLDAVIRSAKLAVENDIEALHELGAEIAYEAVLKLLGSAMVTRDGANAAVREVIKRAKDTTRLIVRLSPADFEALNGKRAALLEGLNAAAVEILPDERVEFGGCLLETPAGNLDGRMEVQLQCLRETLLNARARRGDGSGLA